MTERKGRHNGTKPLRRPFCLVVAMVLCGRAVVGLPPNLLGDTLHKVNLRPLFFLCEFVADFA